MFTLGSGNILSQPWGAMVISEIQSLVRERYAIDKDLMKAIWKIPPSDLEGEEALYV